MRQSPERIRNCFFVSTDVVSEGRGVQLVLYRAAALMQPGRGRVSLLQSVITVSIAQEFLCTIARVSPIEGIVRESYAAAAVTKRAGQTTVEFRSCARCSRTPSRYFASCTRESKYNSRMSQLYRES